jgi:hypothetical protein
MVYVNRQNKRNEVKKKDTHEPSHSTLMWPLHSLSIPQPRHLLKPDTPQTPRNTHNTAGQRQVVCARVAIPAIATDHFAITAALLTVSAVRVRVPVQNTAVHQVEYIA